MVAGTVAILGRPNVGKSTLLNQIVGQKLAIVSSKPQTTRNRILGVWNGPDGQIVFVDTPGVHAARNALGHFMVDEALGAIEGVEAVLLVVTPPERAHAVKLAPEERRILELVKAAKKPTVLAINKVDTVKDKPSLFPVLTAWQELGTFAALVPVSARRGSGVPGLIKELVKLMPEGAPLYSADMLTDRPARFLAGELIRAQLFGALQQELPYAPAVVVENWEERPERNDVVIDASILVERDSQKLIVVGKGGTMIKEVGSRARHEITEMLGRPAHLRLHEKVAPAWTSSQNPLA